MNSPYYQSNQSMDKYIPFNKPYSPGSEFRYMEIAISRKHLSGDGIYTKTCHAWLENQLYCRKALLTHSCTGALEMAALLLDIKPGDEIIMPSYSFVTTANAFVLRGGVPVFVDIRSDTMNLDETKITEAITSRTRAIVLIHYAGIACEMDKIMEIAYQQNIYVIEDAAQGIVASYNDRPLGSIGHLGTLSFHETKNISCGEGGALMINEPKWIERAEVIREKGTNRSAFFRGEVDKYSWVDVGSSYLPSEVSAAFLWAQLEDAENITEKRMQIWEQYHRGFLELEVKGIVFRPVVPDACLHNGHMYFLVLNDARTRSRLINDLKETGIQTAFHYVPLHNSVAGKKYGRTAGELPNTIRTSERLIRLPLWVEMTQDQVDLVIDAVYSSLGLKKKHKTFFSGSTQQKDWRTSTQDMKKR